VVTAIGHTRKGLPSWPLIGQVQLQPYRHWTPSSLISEGLGVAEHEGHCHILAQRVPGTFLIFAAHPRGPESRSPSLGIVRPTMFRSTEPGRVVLDSLPSREPGQVRTAESRP